MNNKWVSRKAVPGERGQKRHQYTLTALGRKELLARLSSFTEQEARSSDGFRLRAALFQVLEPAVRSRILQARSGFLRGQSAHLTAVQANFPPDRYAEQLTSQ